MKVISTALSSYLYFKIFKYKTSRFEKCYPLYIYTSYFGVTLTHEKNVKNIRTYLIRCSHLAKQVRDYSYKQINSSDG